MDQHPDIFCDAYFFPASGTFHILWQDVEKSCNQIYRSGIQSMPVGQYEAAKLLGYSKTQTFFRIIFPQVMKRILPSVTNEVITLVKDTSLAFTISVLEMFAVAKALASSQTSLIPFVAAGLFYYIFNLLVAVIMETVEKRLNYYQ